MLRQGEVGAAGRLAFGVRRAPRRKWAARWWHVKSWLRHRWREAPLSLFVLCCLPLLRRLVPGLTVAHGQLRLVVRHGDGSVTDLGLVGRHLIVTAGKNAIAGAFNNVAPEPELFKFHGFGTGTTAAAVGDTALQTELTTQYNPDSTRPTGSQANATNTYTTVATLSPDTGGTIAVTEWGLFSATSAGTLLDRQVFSAVNLVAGSDSLQATYVLTIS
jgi:hypothetical protein